MAGWSARKLLLEFLPGPILDFHVVGSHGPRSMRTDYLASYIRFTLFSSNLPTPALQALIDNHALSSPCPPFAFGRISNPHPLGIPEGYPQRWVGTLTVREATRDILVHGRHLAGPRLLLDAKKFLIRVIEGAALPPIPYVNRGVPWMLRTKYQGTDMSRAAKCKKDIKSRSRLDFASAGADATAQITLLPWPRATIFLADAAAIRVRDMQSRIELDVPELWFVVYRRWQVLVPGFPNQSTYILCCWLLEITL